MLIVDAPKESEVDQVVRLAIDTLEPRPDVRRLAAMAHGEGCRVARDSVTDAVVGFALASREDACEAHLIALAVAPECQGRGIGGALLRTVQQNMMRSGARRMTLEVRADNVAAQRFYARHGYAPEGLHVHAYPDGADAVSFARPL